MILRFIAIWLAHCLEIPSMKCLPADWLLLIFWTISVHHFGILWWRDSRRERRWIITIGLNMEHWSTVHWMLYKKRLFGPKIVSIFSWTSVLRWENFNLFGYFCYLHAKQRRKWHKGPNRDPDASVFQHIGTEDGGNFSINFFMFISFVIVTNAKDSQVLKDV